MLRLKKNQQQIHQITLVRLRYSNRENLKV